MAEFRSMLDILADDLKNKEFARALVQEQAQAFRYKPSETFIRDEPPARPIDYTYTPTHHTKGHWWKVVLIFAALFFGPIILTALK